MFGLSRPVRASRDPLCAAGPIQAAQAPSLVRAAASLGAGVVLLAILFGLAATVAVQSASAADCPNESIRAEQGEAGLALPDCRAYEMVSPLTSSPKPGGSRAASLSGERVTYDSWNPFIGQENEALAYVSQRSSSGWTTDTPVPLQNGAQTSSLFACNPSFTVSPEIDHVVLVDGVREPATEDAECIGDEPPLVPGEPRGIANIFRTDPIGSFYEHVNLLPPEETPENGQLQAFNSDASVVVFAERARLTADAPEPGPTGPGTANEENIYVWHAGTVRYVPYLSDGTPTRGQLANGGRNFGSRRNIANVTNAVSEDGERIFFEHASKLYLRDNALQEPSAVVGGECTEPAKACTIPIDVSEEGSTEYSVFGDRERVERALVYASDDGSRAFFVDVRKLTPDSTATLPVKNEFFKLVNGKADLYEYDVESGETTDLTVNLSEPANVRGFAGASADASYLYFVAYGNLTGGQQNSNGDSAIAGRANLYLLHGGTTTFIATMAGGEDGPTGAESTNWQEGPGGNPSTTSSRSLNIGNLTSSVSVNGKYIAFPSTASLTGFDNTPAEPGLCATNFGAVPGDGCVEMFVYDSEADQLSCASCSPSGQAPTGNIRLEGSVASLWAGNGIGPAYIMRNASDSGAVFFDTSNPLLPADTNGVDDVYAYEDGELHLISTGEGIGDSRFIDASADGGSVFLTTGQGLVGRDTDNGNSLYVARVGGGFVEPPPLPGCEGEACRGAATGPAASAGAGTAHFSGPGNRVARHKRNCGLFAKRAKRLSTTAKRLRRQAGRASGKRAKRLRRRAGSFAAKGHKLSRQAKACRRDNRRAGK